jgi:mannitol-1-phosphate/altronate dehydrogenase
VLETVSPEGEREYEEITSIQKLLPWQAGLQPLINEGANPQTKVIAFTVTEGVLPEYPPSAGNQQPRSAGRSAGSAKPFTAPSRGFWKSAWRTTPGR